MKKLLLTSLIALFSMSAFASDSDSNWDFSFRAGVTYNFVNNIPEGMSHSGVGVELAIIELGFPVSSSTTLSLGLLDLQWDSRYLEKDRVFQDERSTFGHPGMVDPYEVDGAKAHLSDFTFTFPLGISQKFSGKWGASLFVAPGVGRVSYKNSYTYYNIKHRDSFQPTKNRFGFRLDVRAIIWYEDLGFTLRYQPIGFTAVGMEKSMQTFSAGLSFRF